MVAYVFGSVARGEARRDSDVDLAFLPLAACDSWEVLAARADLARIVGRDVDLVDLSRASTVMRAEILRTGQRLVRPPSISRCTSSRSGASVYLERRERRSIFSSERTSSPRSSQARFVPCWASGMSPSTSTKTSIKGFSVTSSKSTATTPVHSLGRLPSLKPLTTEPDDARLPSFTAPPRDSSRRSRSRRSHGCHPRGEEAGASRAELPLEAPSRQSIRSPRP